MSLPLTAEHEESPSKQDAGTGIDPGEIPISPLIAAAMPDIALLTEASKMVLSYEPQTLAILALARSMQQTVQLDSLLIVSQRIAEALEALTPVDQYE